MKKVGVFLIIVIIALCSLLFIKKEDIEVAQVKSTETEKRMTELTQLEEDTSNLFEIKTNSAQNIDLIFEENQVESNKDLIFYIRTDKSIKGRKVQITENGQKREHKSEVAFINEDQQYCYQYTFLTYKENSISKISITNLPKKDITLYAWVKYNGEKYHIAKAVNSDTGEELQKSEDKSLIPTSNLTQEEINTLKQEDVQIMKNKWADALGIDINDVDKYIDKYNAKGQGKLHKDGQKIKNAKGEEVMINGVGLFHLLDYGYMFNEETIHSLKYWGINCVRLPAYLQYMKSSPVDTVTREERGLETAFDEYIREMDRIIDIATKEGDNVTLTANVTGGSGTKTYKFIECNKTNGEYKLIQDFSTNNKANWEMGKNKVIYVDVKDDVNKTAIRSKAFKVADNSETEKKILDIIVFTGQSNMVGLANKTYKTNIEENTAFEAKWDGNSNSNAKLVDITSQNAQQNLGDNIYNNGKLILEKQKKSTLIPAFVEKYMKETGHKVVFIHTAISGKDIAYFTDRSDTNAISYITKKANKATQLAEEYAKNNNCEIGNKFYIMYQGESDAVAKLSVNQYKETYLSFHKKIIKDTKLEYGGIITPGYWHAKNSHYTDDALDVIVEAQQQLANENEDIILTTKNVTKIYSKDSKYMCSDMLHLNEIGLQKIGTDSAEGLLNGGIKLESIEIKQKPQKLKYNKNDNLDLKEGKVNLKYSDGTVQEKDMTDEMFKVSGYNSANLGKQEVKLNYANNEAKFEIEVIEKQETEKDDPNKENTAGKEETDEDKTNGGKEETNKGNDLEKEEGKDDTNNYTKEDKKSDLTKLEKDDKKTMDISDKELPKAGKIQLGVVIIFIIGFSVFVYYKLKGMRDIK